MKSNTLGGHPFRADSVHHRPQSSNSPLELQSNLSFGVHTRAPSSATIRGRAVDADVDASCEADVDALRRFREAATATGPPGPENEKPGGAASTSGLIPSTDNLNIHTVVTPKESDKGQFYGAGKIDDALRELSRAFAAGLITEDDYAELDEGLRKQQRTRWSSFGKVLSTLRYREGNRECCPPSGDQSSEDFDSNSRSGSASASCQPTDLSRAFSERESCEGRDHSSGLSQSSSDASQFPQLQGGQARQSRRRDRSIFPPPRRRSRKPLDLAPRRMWAASGIIPTEFRKFFTEAQAAVVAYILTTIKRTGACSKSIDEISDVVGVHRSSVKRGERRGNEVGLLSVKERPVENADGVKVNKNLTNMITVACGRARDWLNNRRKAFASLVAGVQRRTTLETQDSKQENKRQFPRVARILRVSG